MWRLTWLFAAQRRSSPTVDPEVCLLGFLWRDLTWSNAKTPTGSAFGGNLSLCLNQVMASKHASISDPQVLLQRRPRLRHFERRRGAAARVFRPLPHPGGIHWGLHGRLDQQKHASQGLAGHYFIKALHSGKRLADLCIWSFQSSGPPSRPPAPPPQRVSTSYEPPTASGDSDTF